MASGSLWGPLTLAWLVLIVSAWLGYQVLQPKIGIPLATSIVYQLPLYTLGYHTKEVSEELLNDLLMQKPQIIIDTWATNPLIPPLVADGNLNWQSPMREYGATADSDVVFSYISEHYVQADRIGGGWLVYEYKR